MKTLLKKKRIAVLCGGTSGEREVSLRSGTNVYNSLKKQGYNVVKIDTKDNFIANLNKYNIEIAFIMLHGKGGEDGAIQGLLETAGIAYTGSKILASAIGMDKVASKRIFESVKIATPKYYVINPHNIEKDIHNIKRNFPFPLVIKPNCEGSSIGISIIKNKNDLEATLTKTVKKFRDVFVEEFIYGQEITAGILGVGKKTIALPILELVPKNEFYDYEAKYTAGMTEFVLPARLPKTLYKKAQAIALQAHQAIGCTGFSRVDLIVSKKSKIPYVHEINTIPGMTDQSDLPAEAANAGISFDKLVVTILESAI